MRVERRERIKIEKNRDMHRDIQRDGEIKERHTEMNKHRHTHTHTDMEGEQGEDLEAHAGEMLYLDGTMSTAAQVVH